MGFLEQLKYVQRRYFGCSADFIAIGANSTLLLIIILMLKGVWFPFLINLYASAGLGDVVKQHTRLDTPIEDQTLLERHHLQNLLYWNIWTISASIVLLYSFSLYVWWKYYVKLRHKSEQWKCQPNKFLTPEDARHEVFLGTSMVILGGIYTGFMMAWIANGGYNTVYLHPLERGWFYLLLSVVWQYFYTEAAAFYFHRFYHLPFFYKNFHKMHHRYKQPTPFSTTAMHPFEFLHYQTLLFLPIFVVPIFAGTFILVMLYTYYYGMVEHSGVDYHSIWPWQPATIFHDRHHEFFHVNFGFNCHLFDWVHDTMYRPEREYGEHIFGGQGRERHEKIINGSGRDRKQD